VVLPDDMMLGGFSTAFGAGVSPDRIIVQLDSEVKGSNFKRAFDIWDEKPRIVVQRAMKWHITHLPSLHPYGDEKMVMITKS
jgi:hypothetical protein